MTIATMTTAKTTTESAILQRMGAVDVVDGAVSAEVAVVEYLIQKPRRVKEEGRYDLDAVAVVNVRR